MRIVFFFILIFVGLLGNAQFGNNHLSSSPNTLETMLGGLKVNRGIINTIYPDTITANLQPIKNYPAAQIWVNDTVYIRNITATRWIAIGAGSGGGGPGSVTNFSIVTANGFSGSVANSTTTPALTITTSITGLLRGDGTAMSAAVAGTDFVAPSGTYFIGTTSNALNRASASQTLTGVSIDGNAATATALQTARTIQGVSFDGTANITIATASEGLSISGIDLRFGGPIGSPSIFSTERTVNTNRLIMHWTNGIPAVAGGVNWQFSKQAYSPFQFISADTITTNNAALSNANPLSGLFSRRTIYYNSGVYRNTEMYGQYLGATYNFQDSMAFQTAGGDFNQAVINEIRIKPRGTGRQVAATGHSTSLHLARNEGIAALVPNFYMDGDGVNTLRLRGTGVGVAPYLIMFSGATDTIDNFVYVQPSSFVGGGAKVLKAFAFAPVGSAIFNATTVDSAFLIFDTTRRTFSYIAGNMLFGPGDSTITQAKLRVNGSTVLNGWAGYLANVATDYTARSFTDKNYVDSSIAAIPAGGSPFLPVTGTGTATGAVTGELAGNIFTVTQGGNEMLHIDPTAGAEHAHLQAINTTGADNSGLFLANVNATEAFAIFSTSFNGGAEESSVVSRSDATGSVLEYSAGIHTFTGTVNLGTAGSSTGVLAVSGVTSGTITIQPASVAGTYTLTLPANDGDAGQFLQTNGSGVLIWATSAGSGDVSKVGTPVNNQLGVWTGDGTIEGDANLTFASSTLTIGVAASSLGSLVLSGNTLGAATITVPASVTSYSFILPSANGTANQILGMNSGATENEYKTLAVGTTGTNFTIDHSANTVTFNLPDASSTARGVITTGTQTITGTKTFSGQLNTTGAVNSTNQNFSTGNSGTAITSSISQMLIGGASNIGYRVAMRGSTALTMTANHAYANTIIAETAVTEAATGTHPIVTSFAVKGAVVTGAAGATDILAGVYIEGPPTGVTPVTGTYGLFVDAGTTRLDGGILGTITNDDATAGNIGEEVVAIQSTYTNFSTTATYQNITSITLTAGDWDISAFMTYSSNSATITAASNAIFVISTTTASAAGAVEGRNIAYVPQAALLGTSLFSESISPYRVSISGSTTYYLNAQATFTLGNPQFAAGIRARRSR